MDIELVKCECCGLKEECTMDYIARVRGEYGGRWICGLCSEAVKDEAKKVKSKKGQGSGNGNGGVEEALLAHLSFRSNFMANPATRVADGMRQMLHRRRSVDLPSAPVLNLRRFGKSASSSKVGHDASNPYI